MQLELKQSLKLTQQLVLTQQVQQAIKLLQLTRQELVSEIQTELVENPALEELPESTLDEVQEVRTEVPAREAEDGGQDPAERIDWERFLEGYSSGPRPGPSSADFEDLPPIEASLVRAPSLADHLCWQMHLLSCTDLERRAAEVIVHNLDERGYLGATIESVAEQAGVDLESAEGALEIVQSLDPVGCGSRDLKECLRVQARIVAPEDPLLVRIIDHHLEHIERRNYAAIARELDIEVEDAVEYHRMIQKMEPTPGRDFSDVEHQYITPDIHLFKVGDEWQIVLNEDGLPKLRVSPYYERILRQAAASKKDREYIRNRLQSAAFLIQSIHRRQRTIYRVTHSILERQKDFFEHGVDALKPMVLRDVAEDIGVHESTVSRATTNKYLQCPFGIFELKYFFNAAISRIGGGDVASETVKARIKGYIAREDPTAPLSDQTLVEMLREDGFQVARRTVAKYRDEQGILPSSRRRSMF
ncbi:MAG: RNA polymerase factor sigma-54 [Deltaproteobacteria bacterium]|nr:RNA polymerase factor sigma-54 [Deltaproteobacteria bacterium]